MGDVGL